VIIDTVDGYLKVGDKIFIHLEDRSYGAKVTRVQTFVESDFRWRLYINPVGTSRFAPIHPDVQWAIVSGPVHKVEITSPRLLKAEAPFAVHVHAKDAWGNVTKDLAGLPVRSTLRNERGYVARYILNRHQV
jgi:hypothetical protein